VGKRTPIRPDYTASLATLIDSNTRVRAMCDTCSGYRDVDLVALSLVKGEGYSLWGRRTRCRITPGCLGFNRFYFDGRGRFSPMRDG
jgi:hypothetical protein